MALVIVSGHGKFGSGLLSNLNLIMGELDNFVAVDFLEGMSDVDLQSKYEEVIKSYSSILFLVDFVGGTPFKTSVMLSSKNPAIQVLAGANIPMLFAAVDFSTGDSITKSDCDSIIEQAKSGITSFDSSALKTASNTTDGI